MRPEVRLSLLYTLTGVLWILFSDTVLQILLRTETDVFRIGQTLKGWLFVTFTAVMLYFILSQEFHRRRKVEDAIREREADFHYLFSNNPHSMWVYDLETLAFLDVNEMALTQYGYSREEFLRMTIKDIRPAEEVPRLLENLQQGRTNTQQSGTWKHQRKDGTVLDVEINSHTLEFAGRRAVMVVAQDVTERMRLQAQILEERIEKEKTQIALTQEMEVRALRARFSSMMSHEFRTPLTTIQTSAMMMDTYLERMTLEQRKNHVSRIESQVKRMIALLDDVLLVMRGESAGIEFKPQPLDLVAIIRSVTDEAQLNAQETHQVVFNCAIEAAQIEGDPVLLRQAIGNLVSNAVKYSPQGGNIDIHLTTHHDKDAFEIVVADQGIGIPEEDQPNLFLLFQRGGNVGKIQGTGLGMAITKQIVDLHQGDITFHSKVGVGTTFFMQLPFKSTHTSFNGTG
jgi:PAS domain S-box-containing protein